MVNRNDLPLIEIDLTGVNANYNNAYIVLKEVGVTLQTLDLIYH